MQSASDLAAAATLFRCFCSDSQPGAFLPPSKGHLATSGDLFGCQNSGSGGGGQEGRVLLLASGG